MTVRDIFGNKKLRSVFDPGSHEFNSIKMQDKLVILAKLNLYDLLDEALNDFREYYSGDNYIYITDKIPQTILCYLNLVQLDKFLPFKRKDVHSEEEIYAELKKQLSIKFEDIFAIERYLQRYKIL